MTTVGVNVKTLNSSVLSYHILLHVCEMFRRNMDRFDGKLPAPYHINATKGSVHIVAVRAFIEYVINNRTATEFLDWVKTTYIPDETFFSSLNHNPHLRVPGSYLGPLKHRSPTCSVILFFPRL